MIITDHSETQWERWARRKSETIALNNWQKALKFKQTTFQSFQGELPMPFLTHEHIVVFQHFFLKTMESLALTFGLFSLNSATTQWQPSHKPKTAQTSQAANVIINDEREQTGVWKSSSRQMKKGRLVSNKVRSSVPHRRPWTTSA